MRPPTRWKVPGAARRVVRPFVFLTLLLVLVAWSELSAAIATEFLSAQEAELARLVNAERTDRDLTQLDHADALRTVARRHSQRMLLEGTIFHNQRVQSDVQTVFPDWARIGENVGVGPTVPTVHQAFMDSPAHRANVLDPDYRWIGVGVVSGGSRMFMTQNFLTLRSGAARPTPAQFRLAGTSRMATAAAIAEFAFTPGAARGAVVAPAGDFHAALAAAALAGAIDGPIVLSPTSGLDTDAAAAVKRALGSDRNGKTVHLVGGPFDPAVRDAVVDLGVNVAAIGGGDHVATAAAVARRLPDRPTRAFIATVADYPDALAGGAVAAVNGWPVLYTQPDRLSDPTRDVLRELNITSTVIVGGTNAVSERVADQLRQAGAAPQHRLAGASRIDTALAVADYALTQGLSPRHVQVATAYNYPDALAGGGLAGVLRAPVVLTGSDSLPDQTAGWLRNRRGDIGQIYLLGGTAAVAGTVENQIADAVR